SHPRPLSPGGRGERGGARPRGQPAQLGLLAGTVGGAHQVDVGPGGDRRRGGLEVDQFGDPVVVDGGAAAVAGQQRGGDAGDAGEEDLVDGLFEDVEAGDPDDGVDVSADDDLQDDGGALGDEDLVAEVLGAGLEVGDGAGAALAAVEAELVVVGGAALGVREAVGQQQQPAPAGGGLDLGASGLAG